ncbi:MAG: site-specific integrase [Planctomycetota bacterium]|nr:site-specific integrase [Planctomycetota bacterium]
MTYRDRRSTRRIPRLTLHKASGRAVVRLCGKDHYCGPWGSPTAVREYDRLIAMFLANDRRLPNVNGQVNTDLSIAELVVAYMKFAKLYYRKKQHTESPAPDANKAALLVKQEEANEAKQCLSAQHGKRPSIVHMEETSEVQLLASAFSPLLTLFGVERVTQFTCSKLKIVRSIFVERGNSLKTCNEQTRRIKRLFRWAVENEMAAPDIYQALQAVRGLRKGRGEAREPEPVRPVPEEHIRKTLPHLSGHVAALVELLLHTGARVGEVLTMRVGDIAITDDVWEYRPLSHKTAHHGHGRVILLGRRAQEALRPFLKADPSAFVFSPKEAARLASREARQQRKTPLTPSQRARRPKESPKRSPGDAYTPASVRRAIARACEKAGIESWHPHQLRHNAATRLREMAGLDVAQTVLGHRRADVTQVYAETSLEKARNVVRKYG